MGGVGDGVDVVLAGGEEQVVEPPEGALLAAPLARLGQLHGAGVALDGEGLEVELHAAGMGGHEGRERRAEGLAERAGEVGELDQRHGRARVAERRAEVGANTRIGFLARLAFGEGDYRVFYDDIAAATRWLAVGP